MSNETDNEKTETKATKSPAGAPEHRELVEPVHYDSEVAAADFAPKGLKIEFLNRELEMNGVYCGQEVALQAVLPSGKNAKNYVFTWSTSAGGFKPEGSATISMKGQPPTLQMEDCGPVVRFVTGGVTDSLVTITAAAHTKDGNPLTGEKKFTVRQPTLGDLKSNLDEKLDDLAGALGGDAAKGVNGIYGEATNIGRNTDRAANALGNISNRLDNVVSVRNTRAGLTPTDDLALWVIIRRSTDALSFCNYANFMDVVLCGKDSNDKVFGTLGQRQQKAVGINNKLLKRRLLPFNDTDAYRLLKTATEAFLLVNGGVQLDEEDFLAADASDLSTRMGDNQFNAQVLNDSWDRYLASVNGTANPMLPYLATVSRKFQGDPLKNQIFLNEDPLLPDGKNEAEMCVGVLRSKLTRPFLLELIWSYWQEEGMLAQTLNAVTYRFQNRRSPMGGRDPLANLEIDPLRPLNNLLWGYLQDEQHRLSVQRRAYEYDHHYGITLQGKAVSNFRPADSRSKFLEAFHHLLNLCGNFFNQDDDTTRLADGFPILNALREVHLILSQGAHNQFGDLPSTARQEMLLQQWLLARPEFREYLPGRNMVALPEPWMDRLEAMKKLQGWTDVSAIHFHNLAVFGEQILLAIRYGAWSTVNLPAYAANWARFWRAEIQGYVHAYRAATGVDLSNTLTRQDKVDSQPPSVHLRNRLAAQPRFR